MPTYPAQSFPMRTVWMAAIAGVIALAIWLLAPNGGPAVPGTGDAELPPVLRVDGDVKSATVDGSVVSIEVPLAVRGDDGVRLTQGGRIDAVTYMAETASASVPATYTVGWLDGNGDEFLDPGEHAVLTAILPAGSAVSAENPAKLVIRPADAPSLTIEDVLP